MSFHPRRPIVVGLTILAGFAIPHVSVPPVGAQDSGSSTQAGGGDKTAANYLGCYTDRQDRDLQGATGPGPTNEACQAFCADRGFPFAATQWGSQCFCGNTYGKYGQVPESSCNMGCSGNPSEKCGGWWANSVYSVPRQGFTQAALRRVFSLSSLVTLVLVVGLLGSLVGLASGFWLYRVRRLLKNTPQSAIRSLLMGFVHVRGNLTRDNPLTSPLTQVPCSYYQTLIRCWQSGSDKNPGHYKTTYQEQAEKEFYLDDGTGKALVNPRGAEYLLPELFHVEIGPKAVFGGGGFGKPTIDPSVNLATIPSEQDVRGYLAKHGIPEVKTNYLLTEKCLLVDHEYSVFGTYVENPELQNAGDRQRIQKGQNERTFVITALSDQKLAGWEGCRAIAWIVGSTFFTLAFLVGLLVHLHILK